MLIEGMHEKNIFTEKYPFRLAVNSEEDFDYPLHWHTAVELIYAQDNNYCVNLNSTDIFMEERDIVFIAGGDIHGFKVKNNKGKRFFIQFDLSKLESFGDLNALKPYLSSSWKITPSADKSLYTSLESQIQLIIAAYSEKSLAYDLFINARVYDILVLLSRGFKSNTSAEVETKRKNIPGLNKLNIALKFIEDNYLEDITLEDAAKAASFSLYHFSRLFKETTEKNFHDYLADLRIKRAEKLLSDSSVTITQAAYSSGFNSIATFNRIFKKIKGFSPADYRKMQV